MICITNNRNPNQKPVQFYVPKYLKTLKRKGNISNAKIIKHTGFNSLSEYLREALKYFIYYLLIKDNKVDSIPERDRLIAYKIYKYDQELGDESFDLLDFDGISNLKNDIDNFCKFVFGLRI